MTSLPISTPHGTFTATYTSAGLAQLHFPEQPHPTNPSGDQPKKLDQWHQTTTRAVLDILEGRPVKKLPPLDLSAGTPFQQKVWKALRLIPLGRTQSYGEIARSIQHPSSSRAVGQACGANPIPLLIPCHRVLAANRKLGGFSGGLHWKKQLLSRETTLP